MTSKGGELQQGTGSNVISLKGTMPQITGLRMGRTKAEIKAEIQKGWKTMEIKAGAKHLYFLHDGENTTGHGGDTRVDLLCLPEHHKISKTTLWVDGEGDTPLSALLQIQSRHSLKLLKCFLSLLVMNLNPVLEETAAPAGRNRAGGRKGTSEKQAAPINPSQKVWSSKMICFQGAHRQHKAPGRWCSLDRQFSHSSLRLPLLNRADIIVQWVPGRLKAICGLQTKGQNQRSTTGNLPLMMRAQREEHHRSHPDGPPFSPQPTSPHPCTSLQESWRRQRPSLLTPHTVNLIKSQIHNTLFKIQMFFTETSRRKGAERNGPTKVIRIHLQGLVRDYSQLIISALCSWRTPRDHIISVLHIHYATNGNTITKQSWYSGKDKISVPSSSTLKVYSSFQQKCYWTWGKVCRLVLLTLDHIIN